MRTSQKAGAGGDLRAVGNSRRAKENPAYRGVDSERRQLAGRAGGGPGFFLSGGLHLLPFT
jgi:hypothetical protein